VSLTRYYSADTIKNNEMARARSMHGKEERRIKGFVGKNMTERARLENQGVDGRIMKSILKK